MGTIKNGVLGVFCLVMFVFGFAPRAQAEYTDDCITFTSASSFTLKTVGRSKYWDGTLWTSTDKTNWTEWNGTAVTAAKAGDTYNLYVRGNTSNTKITGDGDWGCGWDVDGCEASIACSGNIETLRGATGNAPSPTPMAEKCYWEMFQYCRSLTAAPALPATALANYCYGHMFRDCRSLTTAPALPATTLAKGCYYCMFYGCTSLMAAFALPAMTLADWCYSDMFYGCTALTAAPALPATALTYGCYDLMFADCRSLTAAPALPATMLAGSCYYQMFYGCTSLTVAPALPATTLAKKCYSYMFDGCTSLTTAPALPATTLADYCYQNMFYGCTSLEVNAATPGKEWKLPATSTTATDWGKDMFTGAGGTLQGEPELNTMYYIASAPIVEYADDCITFSSAASFTLKTDIAAKNWDGTLWISTDKTSWTKWNGAVVSAAQTGSAYNLYVRGNTSNTKITGDLNCRWVLTGSASIACTGNIETLRGATGNNPSPTKMAKCCYSWMFEDCTSLTNAPELPATTLAEECYYCMFLHCTSLTTAPTLPATTLADGCYKGMFQGCTSMTTVPGLPATTLADECYESMLSHCTALTDAPTLPVTTLANGCYSYMFGGCTSLTEAPALPATTIAGSCYYQMFYGCTKLTAAPALPATTLADFCYYDMFRGCTSLKVDATPSGKEWKIPATSTSASNWGTSMFYGTGGTLQGQPALNTTYYIASAPQPVESGGEIVVPEGKAEEKATEINGDPTVKAQYLNAPEGVETTVDYLGCFDAVATSGSTVAFVLNEKGTNEVAEATEAVNAAALDTVFSEESTMTIDKPLVGFYYSFRQGGDVSVGDQADLNKLGGRDAISFELTKGPLQYFYQTLVTPTALPAE